MALVEPLAEVPDNTDGMTIDGEAGSPSLDKDPDLIPVSKLSEARQFDVLSKWFDADADHSREWRAEARFSFGFRAGHQWTDTDRAMLEDTDRPVIVFNRVLTILKAIAGMEINGRHEISFLPRGSEDTAANEVLSAASKWMAEGCDGEDEESEAFDHCVTCGIGVVEERMSYDDDPAGLYVEECFDPTEFYWDRTAKKKNLKGSRRMWRVRRIPYGDAAVMFRKKDDSAFTIDEMDANWADESGMDYPEKSLEEKRRRDENSYDDRCEITIVHAQWIERETYWLVADEANGQKVELSDDQYRKFKARMDQLGQITGQPVKVVAARLTRKIYKQAFLGGRNTMLRKAEPAPIKGQFSWKVVTGEFDKLKHCWFGLVRVLRDPQMWANKWLSQILHILNTTAKGGIIAETSAFDDQEQAEDSYAHPDGITWAANGALSGDKPRIIPKPGGGMVDGYVGLLTFALSSFKDVSGLNLELLGQQDINQPGVLEMMRKQAGMTVLATLFDSLRRFRKQVGRGRLFFIQNYLSDGRLIRVVSPDQVKAIPLALDKTTGEYDVVVDDTPTSPNQKEANWAIIQPLLVVFKEQLMANPQVLAMLLEYSPLPARVVEAIKDFVKQQSGDPEQQKMKEIAVAREISEIEKNQSVANLNNAKAGGAQATAVYEISMAQNLLHDNRREELAAHLELMADAARARDADAKVRDQASKREVEAAKVHVAAHDSQTRRMDAGTKRIAAVGKLRSDAVKSKTDHVGNLIDHMATISAAQKNAASAEKDRAVARREDRTPVQVSGAAK